MYQRIAWMISKRSKWRPVKRAGASEGSWVMPLIIDILHGLHQNLLGYLRLWRDPLRRPYLCPLSEAVVQNPLIITRDLRLTDSRNPTFVLVNASEVFMELNTREVVDRETRLTSKTLSTVSLVQCRVCCSTSTNSTSLNFS